MNDEEPASFLTTSGTYRIVALISEWLLLNAKWVIFQLFHDENILQDDETTVHE
jgi:hypothetical protein